jgi:hypothetical protein
MRQDLVDGKRFDQLARTVAAQGSRRRLLGGLLAGVQGMLRLRTAVADESSTAFADASGGQGGGTARANADDQHRAA